MIKNMKNNNKGITLIALVVTIIVLLILAGITIATLTDNQNGIFTNAKKARSLNAVAEADERMTMAYTSVKTTIAANVASNSSYDATTTTELQTLARIVATDLIPSVNESTTLANNYGTSGKDYYVNVADNGSHKFIIMKYWNNSIRGEDIKTLGFTNLNFNNSNGTFVGAIMFSSDSQGLNQDTTYYSQKK